MCSWGEPYECKFVQKMILTLSQPLKLVQEVRIACQIHIIKEITHPVKDRCETLHTQLTLMAECPVHGQFNISAQYRK